VHEKFSGTKDWLFFVNVGMADTLRQQNISYKMFTLLYWIYSGDTRILINRKFYWFLKSFEFSFVFLIHTWNEDNIRTF